MIPALNVVKKFGNISGLILNLQKTEGLWLGRNRNPDSKLCHIKWTDGPIRCLGIYVGYDNKTCLKLNWTDKLAEIQRLLDNWRSRELTLFGKIQVLKSLAISKIVFQATNLPIPDEVCKKLTTHFFEFLWGKTDRVKRSIMVQKFENGGLKMIDVPKFLQSLQIPWLKRILSPGDQNWKFLPRLYLKSVGEDNIVLLMNFTNEKQFCQINNIPEFYRNMLINFNKGKETKECNIKDQLLWGNTNITLQTNRKINETIYIENWIKDGIVFVKNLEFVNGSLQQNMLHQKITKKCNLLAEISKVIKGLKTHKNEIGNNVPKTINKVKLAKQVNQIVDITSKEFYNNYQKKENDHPALNKWKEKFGINLVQKDITQIFTHKVSNIQVHDKKLAEYCFKVLHYILSCKHYLSKTKENINDACEICHEKDDVYHLLIKCQLAQKIWQKIRKDLDLDFEDHHIVLGHPKKAVNEFLSQVSYEIYKYWLICFNEKSNRTHIGLKNLICIDFRLKLEINKLTTRDTTRLDNLYQQLCMQL